MVARERNRTLYNGSHLSCDFPLNSPRRSTTFGFPESPPTSPEFRTSQTLPLHLSWKMAPQTTNTGIWGPVTATIDWCEVSHLRSDAHKARIITLTPLQANYQFSPFVAEMANSFSNLITIFLGAYGGYVALQQELPTRYPVGFLVCLILPRLDLDCKPTGSTHRNRSQGVAIVGIGSFAFHASLLYEAQLADELPMILVASYSLFVLSDSRKGFKLDTGHGVIPLIVFNTLFSIS